MKYAEAVSYLRQGGYLTVPGLDGFIGGYKSINISVDYSEQESYILYSFEEGEVNHELEYLQEHYYNEEFIPFEDFTKKFPKYLSILKCIKAAGKKVIFIKDKETLFLKYCRVESGVIYMKDRFGNEVCANKDDLKNLYWFKQIEAQKVENKETEVKEEGNMKKVTAETQLQSGQDVYIEDAETKSMKKYIFVSQAYVPACDRTYATIKNPENDSVITLSMNNLYINNNEKENNMAQEVQETVNNEGISFAASLVKEVAKELSLKYKKEAEESEYRKEYETKAVIDYFNSIREDLKSRMMDGWTNFKFNEDETFMKDFNQNTVYDTINSLGFEPVEKDGEVVGFNLPYPNDEEYFGCQEEDCEDYDDEPYPEAAEDYVEGVKEAVRTGCCNCGNCSCGKCDRGGKEPETFSARYSNINGKEDLEVNGKKVNFEKYSGEDMLRYLSEVFGFTK